MKKTPVPARPRLSGPWKVVLGGVLAAALTGVSAGGAAASLPAAPIPSGTTSHSETISESETTSESSEASIEGDALAVSTVASNSRSGAAPVEIDLLDSLGGDLGDIEIPASAEGEDQHDFVLRGGEQGQHGALQRSADGQWLTIGGFDAEVLAANEFGSESSNINSTFAEEHPRVVARIGADGSVDTSTSLAGAFSESHIRGVVTADGTEYWAGGHGNKDTADPGTGVVHAEHGSAEATAVVPGDTGQLRNHRVPAIHDGQLYVSSDRDDHHGIVQVGEGLPAETIAAEDFRVIAPAPEGYETPHGFEFIGEHLYVAYTEGGLVRYAETEGTWEVDGELPGEYWDLTGRQAGEGAVLYAVQGEGSGNRIVEISDSGELHEAQPRVLAQSGTGETYRGIAFAPGYTPSEEAVETPTEIGFSWDQRVAYGNGNALAGVIGAETNPVAVGELTIPEALEGAELEAAITSEDDDVVSGDRVDFALEEDGSFSLSVDPLGVGMTQLSIDLLHDEEVVGTGRLDYAASAELEDDSALAHHGFADASTAQDVGDGYFLAGDDDTLGIRLYGPTFDEPVNFFPIHGEDHENVPFIRQPGETWDLESSARSGETIYWVGSLGNSRSGNVRDDRDTIAASTVSGSGAEAQLEYAGHARGFKEALVEWDNEDGHGLGAGAFAFERATQQGYSAEGPNSLNVEGSAMAPDGESLWLGFRSPLVGPDAGVGDNEDESSWGDQALIVEIGDIHAVTTEGADIEITDWQTLDLDGRAIRGMTNTQDGNYAIQAGSADDEGNFAIYGWSGDPEEDPVASVNPMGLEGWEGSYESLPLVPSLEDGTTIRVVQDAGTVDLYDTGEEAQDLIAEHMKFFSQDYVLDFEGAFDADPAPDASPAPDADPEPDASPAPDADSGAETEAGGEAESTDGPSESSTETPADADESPAPESASATAASGDETADAAAEESPSGLASTGSTALQIAAAAALVSLIGGVLLMVRRRAVSRS